MAVTPEGATFVSVDDGVRERGELEVDWDDEAAEKHGYETFMLKEIYEQPQAVRDTLGERVRGGKLELEDIGLTELEVQNLRRMVILATGTAYHAGVVGRYVVEEWARFPASRTSRASGATGIRCCPRTRWSWPFRSPARRGTRSTPCGSPARAAHAPSRSRT